MQEQGLTKEFVDFLKQEEVVLSDAIKFEDGFYYEFSNFTAACIPLVIDGASYKTVEHYYQSMKTVVPEERQKILDAETPNAAKKFGGPKYATKRPEWEDIKWNVMYRGVKKKFESDAVLLALLLTTSDKQIIEWTWWGDVTWGMSSKTNNGCNALGKILQLVRKELREEGKLAELMREADNTWKS